MNFKHRDLQPSCICMTYKPSSISTKLKQAHITQQEDHFHLHYSLSPCTHWLVKIELFHFITAQEIEQQNVKRNSTAVCVDDIQLDEC